MPGHPWNESRGNMQPISLNRTAVGLTRPSSRRASARRINASTDKYGICDSSSPQTRADCMAGSKPTAVRFIFLDRVHGIDSSEFRVICNILDAERGQRHAA